MDLTASELESLLGIEIDGDRAGVDLSDTDDGKHAAAVGRVRRGLGALGDCQNVSFGYSETGNPGRAPGLRRRREVTSA
jgi:hypothetical protein